MTDDTIHDRLDRLESLVEQQQETIDRQQDTIEKQRNRLEQLSTPEGDTTRLESIDKEGDNNNNPTLATSGGQPSKVVGTLDSENGIGVWGESEGTDGVGVLGEATGTGDTVGVKGEVTSGEGYGLYTDNDAAVAGVLELATIAGSLTDGNTIDSLLGGPLTVEEGALTVQTGSGLLVENGRLVLDPDRGPNEEEPDNLDAVLDDMARENGTYLVSNDHELQAIAAAPSENFRLIADIDASLTDGWYDGNGFDPLGDSDTPFSGTFDGDGHTVMGLTIDRSDRNNAALFEVSTGTIENVTLTDVDVTGAYRTGTLVGLNDGGTVTGTTVTGTVTNDNNRIGGFIGENLGTVSGCWADCDVAGGSNGAGGLVANNSGSIVHSGATGTVTGSWRCGGLVADNENEGEILESFATTPVTDSSNNCGGLVGRNAGTVEESYALGTVDAGDRIGGLVGNQRETGEVRECFAAGAVSGGSDEGGLVGQNDGQVFRSYWDVPASEQAVSDGGTGLGDSDDDPPAVEMVGDDLHDDFEEDLDFGAVWATVTDPDSYPVLQAIDTEDQLVVR